MEESAFFDAVFFHQVGNAAEIFVGIGNSRNQRHSRQYFKISGQGQCLNLLKFSMMGSF